MNDLLEHAVTSGASDVHISAGEPPVLRISGDMVRLDVPALTPEQAKTMIYSVFPTVKQADFEACGDADFSIQHGLTARFRVNVLRQQRGLGAVLRQIPTKILDFETLGLPPVVSHFTKLPKGLVLVTGPTGSGKSTTLAAMIDLINCREESHILTIEDPIEFVHQSKKALVTQREIGNHSMSFSAALRAALREDPDVILVGELRDLETIQLALTAAETGHLVFGTLHTSSAPKTVDRIIDVFPHNQQSQVRAMLAESLEGVITQTLCKKVGGGRVAALEILVGTTAVRNLIRENKIHQIINVMQTSLSSGMQTLENHLQQLTADDLISRDEMNDKLGLAA